MCYVLLTTINKVCPNWRRLTPVVMETAHSVLHYTVSLAIRHTIHVVRTTMNTITPKSNRSVCISEFMRRTTIFNKKFLLITCSPSRFGLGHMTPSTTAKSSTRHGTCKTKIVLDRVSGTEGSDGTIPAWWQHHAGVAQASDAKYPRD